MRLKSDLRLLSLHLSDAHLAFDLGPAIWRILIELQSAHVNTANHERLVVIGFDVAIVLLEHAVTVVLMIQG